jgi:hypothetical protein
VSRATFSGAAAIACVGAFVCATPAVAQTTSSRLTASVAAGVAAPFHSDLGFTAPEWQLAVRTRVANHASMELFFEEWRHAADTVFPNVPLQGVTGVLGRVGEIRTRTAYTTRAVGWNVLLHGGTRRLTAYGGGGPGYVVFNRRFTQTLNDCTASDPRICQGFENRHDAGSFTTQFVGGAEVAISSRLAAFGQVQVAVPLEDPGSSHSSTTGGIRVRVW